MHKLNLSSQILSEIITHMKYGGYLPKKQRRENWKELVTRDRDMMVSRFPKLEAEISDAFKTVYARENLPSMRSLQFAGKAVEINNSRLYNCCYAPMNHIDSFSELMFLLLAGCGVGYSVQRHHVDLLPEITKPTKTFRYLAGDSLEGWADCVKVLVKAYLAGKALPEFDFRSIRPKGAPLVTSGGKAPGPEPLKDCLHNIQKIFDRKENGDQLTSLEVHDINCFIADAVLAGGIRRSAMIALFDLDDEAMLSCKFGTWYESNPQRGRANNSVVILRHKVKKRDFLTLWKKIELSRSGEPGFFFTNDKEWGLNPCGEISLRSNQFCNLVTINAGNVSSQAELDERARSAAFIATLQASFTDFHYLRPIWRKTTEKEALIGVSLTGIASGKVLSLDLEQTAAVVKSENSRVAELIGIKAAARCTTVKPEGTSSLVLGTSSGIHAWHDKFYIRRIRVGKNEAIYTYLQINHPELLEDDYFKPASEAIICVPIKAPEGAITRHESALDLLERVGDVWVRWVKPGHRRGANMNNVSTTVTIKPDEWHSVGEWMWDNRNNFTALAVLPFDEHSYIQAPYETITENEYNRRAEFLHKINLDDVIEIQDTTSRQEEAACAGGSSCEVI